MFSAASEGSQQHAGLRTLLTNTKHDNRDVIHLLPPLLGQLGRYLMWTELFYISPILVHTTCTHSSSHLVGRLDVVHVVFSAASEGSQQHAGLRTLLTNTKQDNRDVIHLLPPLLGQLGRYLMWTELFYISPILVHTTCTHSSSHLVGRLDVVHDVCLAITLCIGDKYV